MATATRAALTYSPPEISQVPPPSAEPEPVAKARTAEPTVYWADWLTMKVWVVCAAIIGAHVICTHLSGLWSR